MTCPSCKSQIDGYPYFCPYCGYTLTYNNVQNYSNNSNSSYNYNQNINSQYRNYTTPPATNISSNKSPVLALILSLIIVGLGQLYCGKVGKGALMFFLAIFFSLFSFGLGWFIVAVWSAVDAYSTAKNG